MNRKVDLDQLLDRAVDEIRDDVLDPQTELAAAARVWERVRAEAEKQQGESADERKIRDCADFQALIPAYQQGALSDARELLFEDHVRDCVPCRRAVKATRTQRSRKAEPVAERSNWVSNLGWRAAAAAVIFLAVVGLSVNTGVLKVRSGGLIHIEAIDGELFRVTGDGTVPVKAGDQVQLGKGEALRTAKGSQAVIRLEDESSVEMNERSEVGILDEAWVWNRKKSDAILALERGSLIVEASPQGSGHLFVETDDSTTAVTGTVFAVNHGIKGTRVSVIEGEVHVNYPGAKEVLHPGDQTTTQDSLSRIPVAEEISWSRNREKHLMLLAELTDLSTEIDKVLQPNLRYSTDLLQLVSDNTVIYIGLPNVTGSLEEAERILDEKLASSPVLQEWWNDNVVADGHEKELRELVDRVQEYGAHIGEELVITLGLYPDSEGSGESTVDAPLIIARHDNRQALIDLVSDDAAKSDAGRQIVLVAGERPDFSAQNGDLFIWVTDDLVTVGFERESIQYLANDVMMADRSRIRPTDGLRSRLAQSYDQGVEWIVGVDFEAILAQVAEEDRKEDGTMAGLGLMDMQYLIGDRRQAGDHAENRVELTFSRTRRGIAAWLDAPAPVGALDYISPNATLAAGFVMQEPTNLVDELFGIFNKLDDGFEEGLNEFETEHGISIREDIAAQLGGEFAFALDGPILPTPSWKLVVEVYNPEQLQSTIEWAIGEINGLASDAGHKGLGLTTSTSDGRNVYELKSLDTGISVYYTYTEGYLVVGPSTAILNAGIQTRQSGMTLTNSAEFQALLPVDGEVNFSGVVYQNLGTLLGPLSALTRATSSLSEDQHKLATAMAKNARPSLTTAYGGDDRIVFIYTHEGGLISSSLASFFSLQSLASVQELIGQSL